MQQQLMAEAAFRPTKLQPAESRCNYNPRHCQHGKAAAPLSFDIAEKLERFTNLPVTLAQWRC